MTPTAYRKRAGAEFAKRLDELGVADSQEAPESLGRRAALAVAAEQAWESVLDGLLSSAEARVMLGGLSREALRKQTATGQIIALRDDRGRVRYPSWQFDPAATSAYPAIRRLRTFFEDAGLSSWTLAAFCVASQPELAELSPAQSWHRNGEGEDEAVLEAARRAVAELTR